MMSEELSKTEHNEKVKLMKKEQKERMEFYYSLRDDCCQFRHKLMDLKKHKGHSAPFRVILAALEVFDDQISNDYQRYAKRIRANNEKPIIKELQNSLNRERAKREELEKQIREATTSSGLFIKYVKKALSID
jgi:hypothetical protein